MGMLRFLFGLVVIIVLGLPLNYFILEVFMKVQFSGLFYGIFVYFSLLITIVQIAMQRALKKSPQRFVTSFMAAMGIKIFLSLTILMIILYTVQLDQKLFAINFMLVYLIFSFYSVAQILRAQKSKGN